MATFVASNWHILSWWLETNKGNWTRISIPRIEHHLLRFSIMHWIRKNRFGYTIFGNWMIFLKEPSGNRAATNNHGNKHPLLTMCFTVLERTSYSWSTKQTTKLVAGGYFGIHTIFIKWQWRHLALEWRHRTKLGSVTCQKIVRISDWLRFHYKILIKATWYPRVACKYILIFENTYWLIDVYVVNNVICKCIYRLFLELVCYKNICLDTIILFTCPSQIYIHIICLQIV